jgi:predicted fused transcriptional regulator/phosphomethylpyrimidine kinase
MLGEVGDKWLSRLHQNVAKDLRTKGWSQTEIADILGSTQSTISRQMQKPPTSLGASADEATVDGWGHELSLALNSMGPGSRVIRQRLVVEFQFTGNNTIRYDKTLTGLDLEEGQEQRALLRRLEWAAGRLDVRRIEHSIPAVGLNIASCSIDATSTSEVAAFPGRITLVDGALRHHETPSFGSSNHLASVLLATHALDSSKVSILNIRPPLGAKGVDTARVEEACKQLGYNFSLAPKGAVNPQGGRIDVLLDEGDFGWEPTLYILAHNPLDLIDRTHQVLSAIEGMK